MDKYWDDRSDQSYSYKGETFYTITPIPYYYCRRKIVLQLLSSIIRQYGIEQILDLGCGDGEYLYQLCKYSFPMKKFHGVDVSSGMLKSARLRCSELERISFEESDKGTNIYGFHMAYVISVFAHLEDSVVKLLLENMYEHMESNGILCLFEQIAPLEIFGGGGGEEEPAVNIKICLKMQALN